MRLYLDDDSANTLLVRLLQQAGHDVATPSVGGTSGATDPVHFKHALEDNRVVLTHNHKDFQELHDLVIASSGHHPGLFIVRRDNDPSRDLTARAIVRGIRKFLAAGITSADQIIVLNHWR